ncbi:hypothetical protein GQ55_6G257000 [Panicum hallii var. hallii]|uniref:F-box domain-containing protein n=1 Tax=Panicum hallii var. hallii TaxID=1504633 RepID=A0A2T7D9N4_9POAL|nr:hypothetical protein GQ55_6G257000 [Panicum hallii var. hallii]
MHGLCIYMSKIIKTMIISLSRVCLQVSMEKHDWAALPRDILLEILGRLRQVDVLRGAGLACEPWWRAAVEEPALWRTIDLAFNEEDHIDQQAWDARLAMARAAVDRSAGQCESFHGVVNGDLLGYLTARQYPCTQGAVAKEPPLDWPLPLFHAARASRTVLPPSRGARRRRLRHRRANRVAHAVQVASEAEGLPWAVTAVLLFHGTRGGIGKVKDYMKACWVLM